MATPLAGGFFSGQGQSSRDDPANAANFGRGMVLMSLSDKSSFVGTVALQRRFKAGNDLTGWDTIRSFVIPGTDAAAQQLEWWSSGEIEWQLAVTSYTSGQLYYRLGR